MLPRPLLAALTWLLLAGLPAHSDSPPSDGAASGAAAADTASAEPAGAHSPVRGKLLSASRFDGHVFLAFGHPLPGEKLEWFSDPGAARMRSAFILGWQPSFLGLEARLAVGARFWESLRPAPQGPHTRLQPTSFGLDQAWLKIPFEAFSWRAAVQAGIFRWRSHGDAALMGEYLARWDAYPGVPIRWGSPWDPLDSLTTPLGGLRLSLISPGGILHQDALAFRDGRGEGYFSFLWSGALTPRPGLMAGVGAALDELAGGGTTYYVPVIHDDTSGAGPAPGAPRDSLLRFDAWATRFSARMTVDIATLWTGRPREDKGGRIFAEAAVLGWKNYPPYYANRIRRLHAHAGLYLPAFGILQALRLQVERHPVPDWMGFVPFYREGALAPEYVRVPLPSPWWRAQIYLCRSLVPWLDLEASAWREFGDSRERSPTVVPYSTLRPGEEPEMRVEARITARL